MQPETKKQIYSLDAVSDSARIYLSRQSRAVFALYLPVILLFALMAVSLPWIKIDRNIYGRGMIRSVRDKVEVSALNSGIVSEQSAADNSVVSKGQPPACITPDTEMIVSLILPPHEIGLLQLGDAAGIEIDGYPENEWGALKGRVIDIPGDSVLDGGSPVFQVICSLDRTWLELHRNRRLQIRSGMTVRARFRKTRCSLWGLMTLRISGHLKNS